VTAALLIAKLSLLGVLFTFLPLFAGIRVWRRPLAIGMVSATAALAGSAVVALRHTSLSVAGLPEMGQRSRDSDDDQQQDPDRAKQMQERMQQEIAQIRIGQHIAQNVLHRLRRADDGQLELFVVAGHAGVVEPGGQLGAGNDLVQRFPAIQVASACCVEAALATEDAGYLTGTVGAAAGGLSNRLMSRCTSSSSSSRRFGSVMVKTSPVLGCS